ncbi:hypothetical protein A3H03_02510 [Candidatus Kuenenbacteria bacterium RIFCSPLOWO2_12_FULL_42_13]|uniref:Uncharacterized protein n=1 Tax=Candidatus Kuenenbacteria bacterium RIFCSPLOWO2_12_FULL_42_13 TaxID=1798565 RepID=A0A1F6G029_9BACT|nr:MAG: hypothetical protein A3H03_02510 [Candidatus Kuenenbacteria bacterium RIFCSPLOWO2_12_FULL_42_13]
MNDNKQSDKWEMNSIEDYRGGSSKDEIRPEVHSDSDEVAFSVDFTGDNPKAQAVEKTLQPDTRGFFGKICEKVLGKDAADRLLIFQKEIGQGWAEKKVTKAEEAVGEASGKAKDAAQVVEKRETDAAKYQEGKEALGMKVSDEALASFSVEIDSLRQKQTTAKDKLDEETDTLANKEMRVQEYEEVIDGAKHNLDGRLAEKMEVNNKALAERTACVEKNRFQAAENSSKMKGLMEQRMGVETLMKAGLEGAILKDARATIAGLQKRIDELDALNDDLGKQNGKIGKEMGKFSQDNQKLQGKRDKLFPSIKEKAWKEKAAAGDQREGKDRGVASISASVDDYGRVVMDRINGGKVVLDGERLIVIAGNGNATENQGEEITDEELNVFMGDGSVSELLNAGAHLSQGIIQRMQAIEEKRRLDQNRPEDAVDSHSEPAAEIKGEKAKKHNLEEIVSKWNRYVNEDMPEHDKVKYKIRLDKAKDDPQRLLGGSDAVTRELKKRLAKKFKTDSAKLDKDIINKVYNFLRELNEGKLNY